MSVRLLSTTTLGLLTVCAACGGVEPDTIRLQDPVPDGATAGQTLDPIRVQVLDDEGAPIPGVVVLARVERGGGSVAEALLRTQNRGVATIEWTLGAAPVVNRLRIDSGSQHITVEVTGTLDEPLRPEDFGGIHGQLVAHEIEGSTEDLAFDATGRLLMGVPEGIIAVEPDGTATPLALTGEPLGRPLGLALDAAGNLWVADSGDSVVRRISREGEVVTIFSDDGTQPLDGPNYVAFDEQGALYLSDPCLGELIRYDPAAEVATDVLAFDLHTQGGPNGIALDPSGEALYIATENTGLLCNHGDVGLVDHIAGLYRVAIDGDGLGELEPVAEGVALFGDGLAFDGEGNLYVIFDTEDGLALEESVVWVLPEGGGALVRFLSVDDQVMANLAFGSEPFGATTLYIALLSVAPFTSPEKRGLLRFEVGIEGLVLGPERRWE